jgi:hypothetical protein
MSNEVKVSDAEIKAVEAQVKAAESKEHSQIEERVRKELAAESRAKDLESQLAAQMKAAEDAKAEAAQLRAESEALVKQQVEQRLKQEVESRSKATVNATNPFKSSEEKVRFTPEITRSIEGASYEAFLDRNRKPTR